MKPSLFVGPARRLAVVRRVASVATSLVLLAGLLPAAQSTASSAGARPLPPVLNPTIDVSRAALTTGASPAQASADGRASGQSNNQSATSVTQTADKTKWGPSTRVYDNSDGTYTAEIYSEPVNYKDSSGNWQVIDQTLIAATSGAYSMASKANNLGLAVSSKNAAGAMAKLNAGSHTVKLRAPGYGDASISPLAPGSNSSSGSSTSPWSNPVSTIGADGGVIFPGSGNAGPVFLDPTTDGFEFGAVMASATSASTYAFGLDAGGLNATLDRDGVSVDLIDAKAAGSPIAIQVGAPIAIDAAGLDSNTGDVHTYIVHPGDKTYPAGVSAATVAGLAKSEVLLVYVIDPAWLGASGRTYPVTLDPTVTTCISGVSCPYGGYIDTNIDSGKPTVTWSGYNLLRTGLDARGNGLRLLRAMVIFGHQAFVPAISPFGSGVNVTSASLALNEVNNYGNGSMGVYAGRMTKSWDPWANGSWNLDSSAAVMSSSDVAMSTCGHGTGVNCAMTVPVTDIVSSWYTANSTAQKPDYGFMLESYNETKPEIDFNAGSIGNNSYHPKLTLTYKVPSVTVAGTQGAYTNGPVSWSYSADGNGPETAAYIEVSTSSTDFSSPIWKSGSIGVANCTTCTYAIPTSAGLADGQTYYWHVVATDGVAVSAPSAAGSFKWDGSGPSLNVSDNCATAGGCYRSGNTIFYQPSAAKTINLTATASDPQTGLSSVCFGSLSAGASWTYTPACQSTSPLTVPIGWSASAGQTTLPVTATNTLGGTPGTTTLSLTFSPTQQSQIGADFSTPNEGATTPLIAGSPYSVAWSESDTGGPGIASRSLQRTYAPMSEPGVCPTGTYGNDGLPTTTPSPVAQTGLTQGYCYRWILTLTDNTNNVATFSSGLLVRDGSSAFGQQAQMSFESWDLAGGDQAAVNVTSGNLVVSHSIVSLPIRGSSVSLALTYNSQDSANVGLGTGWRLNVQRRLTVNADGSVTFVDSDGARYLFTNPVTNGTVTTYTRPTALFATLTRDTSKANQFTLTYKDLSADQFSTAGSDAVLVRQQDRYGNGVTIAYNGGTEDIATITDDTGRVINLAWNTTSTPHQLSSITDWAWIDGSGVVQTTATGTRRTYRFFYDGTGAMIGWSDPLNTTGSCPTAGSHLTCLTYAGGQLTGIAKTQTYTTYSGGSLGSATHVVSTAIGYTTGDVASVTDALTNQTTFDRSTAGQTVVRRPATGPVTYAFSPNDPYARVTSVSRSLSGTPIVESTVWDTGFPTLAHTVTENSTAALNTPSRTVTYTYVAGSLGNLGQEIEPLTASTNRQTDDTYNSNNDLTQQIVSQDGSSSLRTITRYCYDSGCSLTGSGLSMVAQIDDYVSSGGTNNDTNVRTDYGYDAYGQKTSTTRHNRNAAGTDLDDRKDASVYDNYGDLKASITNYSDGNVTVGSDVTPDANGVRTDLTTVCTFDTAGNQVSVADPRRAIELALGSAGADDYLTRSSFNALNESLSTTTPTTPGVSGVAQKTSSSVYDEFGSVRAATDQNGIVTGTAFDPMGHSVATYEIDPAPLGPSQTGASTFDAAGRLRTSKDARQVSSSALGYTLHGYDDLGQQTSVTAADGSTPDTSSVTTTSFDGLGRKLSETGAFSSTSYTNDLGGRVPSTDDGLSCSTSTFDFADRATSTTTALDSGTCTNGGDAVATTNSYDGLGRLILAQITAGASSGDKTTNDTYDSTGDKLTDSTTTAGVIATATTSFNLLGETFTTVSTDGSTTKSDYDVAGNMSDNCLWASGTTIGSCYQVGTTPWTNPPTKATSSVYDAGNNAIGSADAATGMTTTYDPSHDYAVAATYLPTGSGHEYQTYYTYDAKQRVATLTHQDCIVSTGHSCSTATVIGSDAYIYDSNDNRTRVTEYNGAVTTDRYYCYDAKNQLVAEKSGSSCTANPDETYTYDDSGNRLSATVGGATTDFAYDSNSRLCAVGPTASCNAPNVTYDDAGRTLTLNGWYFVYDSAGRLLVACQSTSCTGSGFNRVDYAYDGDNKRTQIRNTTAAGVVTTTVFTYQSGLLVGETVNGTPSRNYLAAGGSTAEMMIPSGSGAGTYVVTWNGHGDATSLNLINSDSSLTPVNSFRYSTWGTPTTTVANGGTDLASRFRYVGSADVQWDDDFGLGLEYMHARTYSPALGRFIQADPSGIDRAYLYANNSPASFTDATGTNGSPTAQAGPPIPTDQCNKFLQVMRDIIQILPGKWQEIVKNPGMRGGGSLPEFGGSNSVQSHRNAYEGYLRGYNKARSNWDSNHCQGGPPPALKAPYNKTPHWDKVRYPAHGPARAQLMPDVNGVRQVLITVSIVALVGTIGLGACYIIYTYWWVGLAAA